MVCQFCYLSYLLSYQLPPTTYHLPPHTAPPPPHSHAPPASLPFVPDLGLFRARLRLGSCHSVSFCAIEAGVHRAAKARSAHRDCLQDAQHRGRAPVVILGRAAPQGGGRETRCHIVVYHLTTSLSPDSAASSAGRERRRRRRRGEEQAEAYTLSTGLRGVRNGRGGGERQRD